MNGTQAENIAVINTNDDHAINKNQASITPSVSGGAFYVRTLTGGELHFSYSKSMTVAQLKQDLSEIQNIPVSEQRLIFNATQLDDNKTLSECGVVADSTIDLVLRLKGGY